MVFTNDIARALLAVDRQVAVGEVVASQALVAGDPGAFEIVRERRGSLPMWTSLRAKPVAALTVILKFVDHHCQHSDHLVIHTLHPTIAISVV